jgi:hypothetical protein
VGEKKNEKIKTVSLLTDGLGIDGLDRQKYLFLFVFYLLAAKAFIFILFFNFENT